MFAQSFDQPFELVIISSDGSPIDCFQQNSSHEIRALYKSRVTVLIKKPSVDQFSCSSSSTNPINSGDVINKVNGIKIERTFLNQSKSDDGDCSRNNLNSTVNESCAISSDSHDVPIDSAKLKLHIFSELKDANQINDPSPSNYETGATSGNEKASEFIPEEEPPDNNLVIVSNSASTAKFDQEKLRPNADGNPNESVPISVKCEKLSSDQLPTDSTSNSSRPKFDLKEVHTPKDDTIPSGQAGENSESEIELDWDSAPTSSDPFTTTDDEIVTKKRPENYIRKNFSSHHDEQNSVDQNLHDDYLLQAQTKVHVLRLGAISHEPASILGQIYSEQSENLFKSKIDFAHRYIPHLKESNESDQDSCSSNVTHRAADNQIAFIAPPETAATCSRILMDFDSEADDADSLQKHEKSKTPSKRKVKTLDRKKRKRVIVQSSSDSEDLDEPESELPEVQYQSDGENLDKCRVDSGQSINKSVKVIHNLSTTESTIKKTRSPMKRKKLDFDLQNLVRKDKMSWLNYMSVGASNSKNNDQSKKCATPINTKPGSPDIGNSSDSDQSVHSEGCETNNQMETSPLDSVDGIKDGDESSTANIEKEKLNHEKVPKVSTLEQGKTDDEVSGNKEAAELHVDSIPPESEKVPTLAELEEETIKATTEELERNKRLIEQEKKYNQLLSRIDDKRERLILDMDENGTVRVEVDSALLKELKSHQVEGIKFMYNATIENVDRLKEGDKGSGCILAHCMGLGKTFQAISFVHTILSSPSTKEYIKTVLIAVPVNVLKNWKQEFDKWIKMKKLKSVAVFEINEEITKSRIIRLRRWRKKGGVLIIGHHLLGRLSTLKITAADLKRKSRVSTLDVKLSRKYLVDPGPDLIIIDEGHKLKSPNNRLSQGVVRITTRRKILLTGTPLQNNLEEYYTMADVIKPRLLGSRKDFAIKFRNPIEKGQKADSTEEDNKLMKEKESILHKLLEGSIQRYNFETLKPFLEPKIEYALFIRPTKLISTMYNHYLDHICKEKRLMVHAGYLRFCVNHPAIYYIQEAKEMAKKQASNHAKRSQASEMQEPKSDDATSEKDWYKKFIQPEHWDVIELSCKFVMFFRILKKCISNGEKLVVASQSIETLDLIAKLLEPFEKSFGDAENPLSWDFGKNYFRIDGSIRVVERHGQIERFNDPENKEARLFLLSTRAGGIGINLYGANRCIIFDVSWNPSDDIQAICRVYRMGQTKPVYVYRFVTKDTMEEQIFRKQIVKLGMAIRVVDQQQVERIFTTSELKEFYDTRPKDEYQILLSDISKPRSDLLLTELLSSENEQVLKCIEFDSLLVKKPEEDLTEIERQLAWANYQNKRDADTKETKERRKTERHRTSSQCDDPKESHDLPTDVPASTSTSNSTNDLSARNTIGNQEQSTNSREPNKRDLPQTPTKSRNLTKRKNSVQDTIEKNEQNATDLIPFDRLFLPSTSGHYTTRKKVNSESTNENNSPCKVREHKMSRKKKQHGLKKTRARLILDVDSNQKVRVEVNSAFVEVMKSHQVEGIKFLYNSTIESVDKLKEDNQGSGCILAHCMGSGKTFQAIAFAYTILSNPFTKEYIKTVLIAAPGNLIKSWIEEFDKWVMLKWLDPPDMHEINDMDDMETRLSRLGQWRRYGGVLFIDHDILVNLLNLNLEQSATENLTFIDKHLANPGPDLVIIDEGHKLESTDRLTREGLSRMRTQRKILLSGIPLQNHLNEYYTMVSIIKPRLLGSERDFITKFREPIEKGSRADSSVRAIKQKKEKESILEKLLESSIQRISFGGLKHCSKVEYALFISPTEGITTMYNFFLDKVRTRTGHIVHANYLRLLVNHPAIYYIHEEKAITGQSKSIRNRNLFKTSLRYDWFKQFVEPGDWKFSQLSSKFVVFYEILQRCISQGDKLVVASQSYETLDHIEKLLVSSNWITCVNYFRLNDNFNSNEMIEQVNRFNDSQNGEAQLFLISTRSKDNGINLTGANRMIIFDVAWDSNDDIRAICRIYRIGQTKRVYIYRFITKDTMEELIFRKQIVKSGTAFRVNDQQHIEQIFTPSELELFYDTRPLDNYSVALFDDPKDRLLSDILSSSNGKVIYKCIELNSMVENELGDGLSLEERKMAWAKYQRECKDEIVEELERRKSELLQESLSITPISTPSPTISMLSPGSPMYPLSSNSSISSVSSISPKTYH